MRETGLQATNRRVAHRFLTVQALPLVFATLLSSRNLCDGGADRPHETPISFPRHWAFHEQSEDAHMIGPRTRHGLRLSTTASSALPQTVPEHGQSTATFRPRVEPNCHRFVQAAFSCVPWQSTSQPALARRKRPRLYGSLRAVKVRLLRSSTVTVLAPPEACSYVLCAKLVQPTEYRIRLTNHISPGQGMSHHETLDLLS